jgi:hypothetical protein
MKPTPPVIPFSKRGNPYAGKREKFRAILYKTVSKEDWAEIIAVMVEQAKAGDRYARKDLMEHLIGKPQQEISLANAAALFDSDEQQEVLNRLYSNGTTHTNGVRPAGEQGPVQDAPAHPIPGTEVPGDAVRPFPTLTDVN